MNSPITKPACVLCGMEAVTTAARFLVCEAHWQAYADEAKQDLPLVQRPFYLSLLSTEPVVLLKLNNPGQEVFGLEEVYHTLYPTR